MNDENVSAADAQLARIRALLAKAEATEYEGEARLYNEKAAALLAKYGLDRALLDAGRPDDEVVGDRRFRCDAPYAYDKIILLNGIAEALGAQALHMRRAGYHELHVFATGVDLERIDLMFTSLLVQAMRFMAADLYSRPVGDVKVWKRDWLRGFAATVRFRLVAAERAERDRAGRDQDTGPSVALVLADRSSLVERRYRQEYPRARATSYRRSIGAGYGQGQAAGQRVDLGGSRVGNAQRRPLGR